MYLPDMSDPFVKLIAETLIKTATSKTVDLSISTISKLLGKAIKDGDQQAAERVIKEESIEAPVAQIARDLIRQSYVVHYVESKNATADDKLSLFAEVVRLGWSISERLNSDVILPGSILNSSSVSCFSTKSHRSDFQQKDRTLVQAFSPGYEMGILPSGDPADFCVRAAEKLRERRELTTSYISFVDIYSSGSSVDEISTRSLKFRNSSKMNQDYIAALGVVGRVATISDWDAGIKAMVDFARELTSIDRLPEEEGKRVVSLLQSLENVYRSES